MGELIFNIAFVTFVVLMPLMAILRKIENHRTDKQWEEIKRQNSEKEI